MINHTIINAVDIVRHNQPYCIYMLCGKICSGKSFVTNKLYQMAADCVNIISVSSIVKRLSGHATRSNLQKTADLLPVIWDDLNDQIEHIIDRDDTGPHKTVIIDGIRQVELIENIAGTYGLSNTRLLFLEPGYKERQTRYEIRQQLSSKDDIPFAQADRDDYELLGLRDITKLINAGWGTQISEIIFD